MLYDVELLSFDQLVEAPKRGRGCFKDGKAYETPQVKFIYSERATKFFEIFTLLLSYVVPVKSKVKISQNFVAFS